MTTETVLITDCDLPGAAAEQTLAAAGHAAVRAASTAADDIIEAGKDATALIVQWAPITADVLDALPHVRFISRLGIGYDMIDVDAATARGIAVANTPNYCIEEVASHTVAMIMALSRGLLDYDRAVRAGTWSAVAARPMAARPSTTTVSVIGFGSIGSMVARNCAAMGFNVLVVDPFLPHDRIRAAGFEPVSRQDALDRADILTLHVPLTANTRHMLDATALATMKPGSIVVNTCRGPLIDEDALAESLQSGHIGAAGLDVFVKEPLDENSPLRAVDGLLLTPHAAWYSPEALLDLPEHAANNVVEFLAGRRVGSIVNREYLDQLALRASN